MSTQKEFIQRRQQDALLERLERRIGALSAASCAPRMQLAWTHTHRSGTGDTDSPPFTQPHTQARSASTRRRGAWRPPRHPAPPGPRPRRPRRPWARWRWRRRGGCGSKSWWRAWWGRGAARGAGRPRHRRPPRRPPRWRLRPASGCGHSPPHRPGRQVAARGGAPAQGAGCRCRPALQRRQPRRLVPSDWPLPQRRPAVPGPHPQRRCLVTRHCLARRRHTTPGGVPRRI
jgi:hypothetical protein